MGQVFEMASSIVEVKNLKKYFAVERGIFKKAKGVIKAVDGVSLSLKKGQTLGLVGKSGCGKTTLARLLGGIIPPTAGEIIYNPQEISNLHKDIQIIFQNPYQSLNPKMRIWDILLEPLVIHRLSRNRERKSRVVEMLKRVGLDEECLLRWPIQFSGGQRQRISLARALILEPKFLVLDEPVSSLDLTLQVEIIELLKNLKRDFNLSYIFISHNLSVVRQIADQIYVMDNGKISEKIF